MFVGSSSPPALTSKSLHLLTFSFFVPDLEEAFLLGETSSSMCDLDSIPFNNSYLCNAFRFINYVPHNPIRLLVQILSSQLCWWGNRGSECLSEWFKPKSTALESSVLCSVCCILSQPPPPPLLWTIITTSKLVFWLSVSYSIYPSYCCQNNLSNAWFWWHHFTAPWLCMAYRIRQISWSGI